MLYVLLYFMEASSFQDTQEQIDDHNVSLNETANSIHFNYGQKDKQMSEINDVLRAFVSEKLMVNIDFSYETIQNNPIISKHQHQVIKPIPNVYFLPSTVLFLNQKTQRTAELQKIKEYMLQLQRNDYQLRLNRQKKELNLIIHNKLQLLFYSMRVNKSDSSLHRDPKMLDSKYLIDKLYEYYEKFYAKLYFRETGVLILYWAYQHDLLDTTISQQSLKLIIICNFINFGYGVNNILLVESTNQEKMKLNKKMNSYVKINSKGETQILQGLTTQFFNYTIQQKRGFYLVSKKKFMQIKDIVPVLFPVLPLSNEEERKITAAVYNAIKGPIEHPTETMSISKNVSKIFRFLHNKFQKPMRLVIDFSEHSAYRSQYADTFEIQVIHPVLNASLCKIKDGEIRQLKRQINHIHEKFMKNEQPLQIMTFLMEKTRR